MLSGTGRLDGGVQRQQVGLIGDIRNDADHLTDTTAGLGQRRDRLTDPVDDADRMIRRLLAAADALLRFRIGSQRLAYRVGRLLTGRFDGTGLVGDVVHRLVYVIDQPARLS